jgi:RHH-type transcriptional regulator, rel operon repressor / antitoxin RelB
MHTISFHIEDFLNQQLESFAEARDRSKAYIIRKAVESYLLDQDDLRIGQEALEEFYDEGFKTYSLSEVKKENDL